MSTHKEIRKITTNTLLKMKQASEKIAMITAYDFPLPAFLMLPESILSL